MSNIPESISIAAPKRRGRPKQSEAEKLAAKNKRNASRFTIEVNDPDGHLKKLWLLCDRQVKDSLNARMREARDKFPEFSFENPESTNANTLRAVMMEFLKTP